MSIQSIEQVAQKNYETYMRQTVGDNPSRQRLINWSVLDQRQKSAWIAATQAVRRAIEGA